MGKFILHPTLLSDITLSLVRSSKTSNYIVAPGSIDMNEAERIKVLYSDGEQSGAVRKTRMGLVPITFKVVVFGSTQANAMVNYRTLVRAITNPQGGTLEYVPDGLSGVLSTYYHYLQSAAPRIRRGGMAKEIMEGYGHIDIASNSYAIECIVKLMTEAWATSDPETLITINAQVTLDNHDDASNDNHLVVSSSSIKGDVLFPFITAGDNYIATIQTVLLQRRRMRIGANTNLDWIEAEDVSNPTNFSSLPDASVSGGDYMRCTAASGDLQANLQGLGMDSTYFGKITPILCVRVDTSTTYSVTVSVKNLYATLQTTPAVSLSGNYWQLIYTLSELDLPPITLPSHLDDDTSPTIGAYVTEDMRIQYTFTRTSGSGGIDVDFLLFAKADQWIGNIQSAGYVLSTTSYLKIDSISQCAHLVPISGGEFWEQWGKYGSSWADLGLEKGFDHRLRFFWHSQGTFSHTERLKVDVKGIFGTVYPFEVA